MITPAVLEWIIGCSAAVAITLIICVAVLIYGSR